MFMSKPLSITCVCIQKIMFDFCIKKKWQQIIFSSINKKKVRVSAKALETRIKYYKSSSIDGKSILLYSKLDIEGELNTGYYAF